MRTAGSPSLPATRRDRDHGITDRPVDVDRSAPCPVSVQRVLGRDGTRAADPLSTWQLDRSDRDAGDGDADSYHHRSAVRMVVR